LFHGTHKLALILDLPSEQAAKHGLAAMDALHVAAASAMNCLDFITAEGKTKPLYRTKLVRVFFLNDVTN